MSPKRTITLTTPNDTEIHITRVFNAPRRLVFDALTKPELMRYWFHGPPGWTLAVCEVDLRVGGAYRHLWRGPDGAEMGMRGVIRELEPPIRMTATERFDQAWYPGEGIVTNQLEESGGRTTLTLIARYESREARDMVLRSPMDQGVEATYNNLEAFLASQQPSSERRDLVFTRVFDAPVELVWRAWTVGEYVRRWWGPDFFTCPSAVMDVREGGTSVVCMRAPKEFGGQDMYNSWHYTRIVPMERIEFTQNMSDAEGRPVDPASLGLPPDFPRDQRNVVTFRSLGEKTELTVTEYAWIAGRMMQMAEMGMNQCLNKMADSLRD